MVSLTTVPGKILEQIKKKKKKTICKHQEKERELTTVHIDLLKTNHAKPT